MRHTDSLLSDDDINRFKGEIDRLEQICKCSALKFSDVRSLLREIDHLKHILACANSSLAYMRGLAEKIADKAYLQGSSLASEVQFLAEQMLYGDVGDRQLKYINRLERLADSVLDRVKESGSLSKDDSLVLELTRLKLSRPIEE